jgi:hypothetical protein
MASKCAECLCVPQECGRNFLCLICNRESCCVGDHARRSGLSEFFHHARRLYAAALGIEILCIAAAEIGENSSLYIFGFNPAGIAIAYAMGYALAGLATFLTILGRYNGEMACGCCSVLEQNARKGLVANLMGTMRDFEAGVVKLRHLYRQPNLKQMLKSSIVILVTAESACILTAETVDLIFYQYSLLLSVPLALLAGAFTVVAPEAYRKIKARS